MVHIVVGMSWLNFGIAALFMINSATNNYHAAAGLIVASCIGCTLSGRPMPSLIRRITGWAQGICYPRGILLGNALGLTSPRRWQGLQPMPLGLT